MPGAEGAKGCGVKERDLGVSDVADHSRVPGVVIAHSPAASERYIGSPGLAVAAGGRYVASHDFFGPGTTYDTTRVYASEDRGETWDLLSEARGQFWSSLFAHAGALYLFGTDRQFGDVVIRRSDDGGSSWTTPATPETGMLMTGGRFHCAPMPVLPHEGRLWRAFEDRNEDCAFVLSAPAEADLLRRESWTVSERMPWGSWNDWARWLEGNVVRTPEGGLVDILRVHAPDTDGRAAAIRISADGRRLTFDPDRDFVRFPGGCKKFTIRHDPETDLYWSLTNFAQEKDRARALTIERQRNTLALTASRDLVHWDVRDIVLYHPDVRNVGFQYVDFLFEDRDIIALSRTAYDDGLGGAHNCHDSNYLTFHRLRDFRNVGRAG